MITKLTKEDIERNFKLAEEGKALDMPLSVLDGVLKKKVSNKVYQEAHREKIKAYWKAYYEAHRDKIKAYREANKERLLAKRRERYRRTKEG